MAQGFGSLDAVSSPTFVIVNQYRRPDGAVLSHLDAYRLQNAYEGEDLDLYLMLERGALVVEWPERIDAALPVDRLWVKLRYMAEEQRGMQFNSHGKRYEALLSAFRRQVLGG
jgi:tRNA threonylcarbamoyladenosine biosynthesis protein TsaE